MPQANKSQPASFEAALEQLETLVTQIESGSLPLAESIDAYEKGIKLQQYCQKELSQSELRLEKLQADGTKVPVNLD